MHILDPISLPLNQSSLIEASAGTGKTYTMANLYLRLILGVGCEPMSVEQILVVTFTKAATQELRERIRAKLKEVTQLFEYYHQQPHNNPIDDPFILSLYQQVEPHLYESLLRLKIAEQEIDLASIFTIDSFAQKMLFQFAFNSGIRFDIELQANEEKLLLNLCEETWREMFYPMNEAETAFVASTFTSPKHIFDNIKGYLSIKLPPLSVKQQYQIQTNFSELFQNKINCIMQMKAFWQTKGRDITELIENEITKIYKPKQPKALSRSSYKKNVVESAKTVLNEWAFSNENNLPADKWERFTQSFITNKVENGAAPLIHPLFSECEHYFTQYNQIDDAQLKALLQFQFLQQVQQKLDHYKQSHKDKSFNDITYFLHQALFDEMQGEALVNQIRQLFPFAMIDEFQDTNQIQYDIFSRIFMRQTDKPQGFIMIGDPKQSIYQFRGADIFTYLKASQQVNAKYTLNRNWRSLPDVVENTNCLFQFPADSEKSPFLYQGISFQAVDFRPDSDTLVGNSTQYYLQDEFNEGNAADWCAYHIQQQLKQAEQKQFGYKKADSEDFVAFEAKDITILVRSHTQAQLIRQALLKRQIRSVFYSEKSSVYQSDEANDLLFILKAVLNPNHSSSLLNALSTSLWGLTAQEIYHLKNDETKWDQQVEHFIALQQIWQQQGLLPMLHRIFLQHGVIKRLNSKMNAERRITDLLHLSELLQEAMTIVENENALVRWYQQQLDNPNQFADEQKLRLESEEDLVKVVTIHGSKGLEYPIVWLPFIGKSTKSTNSKTLSIYQDEKGEHHWAFGQLPEEIKIQINEAEYAEDLRLLYVAITRAKYQLNVILPNTFNGWNAMHYLLSNGELGNLSTQDYLAQKGITNTAGLLQGDIPEDNWQATPPVLPNCKARIFTSKITTKGMITSFSALQEQNEFLHSYRHTSPLVSLRDQAQDYDQQWNEFLEGKDPEGEQFSPYYFPHSSKVGNLFHKLLENWDFHHPIEESILKQLITALNLNEEWLKPLEMWCERIVTTPFTTENFSLRETDTKARLNEWQFYLRLRNENALPKLNLLLKQHSKLAEQLPDLQLKQLEGFVRGFIDCIVQVNGKYYIIDYKSNFLGYSDQDYLPEKLENTMMHYRYDLQYLLYTLALHRYLRSRLGEHYDYEQDFGGVAYLFLRAMNGTAQSGVYFDKPSKKLIEEMDQLFG